MAQIPPNSDESFREYGVKTYGLKEFDLPRLIEEKRRQGLTTGVCIPVRNEDRTIGEVINLAQIHQEGGLVDKILVVDSHSTDRSEEVTRKKGVPFLKDEEIARELGLKKGEWKRGKGFNMWAALHYLETDVVTYLDSDLASPPGGFVYGPLAPLILNAHIQFSKGGFLLPETDNRATRLVAEPQIGMLFPEVVDFFDPLSGMFAARTPFLKEMPFPTGYSVELHTLIESYFRAGKENVAQVFLGEISNGHRDNTHYGRMAGAIGYYLLQAAERHGRVTINHDIVSPRLVQHIPSEDKSGYTQRSICVRDLMLPPMAELERKL